MDQVEKTIEKTAGQPAAGTTNVETPVADQAEKEQVVQDDAENIIATETDSPSETVETAQAMTTSTTEQPEKQPVEDQTSCPARNYPRQTLAGVVVLVIVIAIVVKLLKKKKNNDPGKKGNDKFDSADVVEIYAGNLSYDMTDNQLRKEFERFGVVKSARVITHRTSNKSKGYGFVEMPHRKEALIAIEALENTEVMGRRIRVNEARANTRPSER